MNTVNLVFSTQSLLIFVLAIWIVREIRKCAGKTRSLFTAHLREQTLMEVKRQLESLISPNFSLSVVRRIDRNDPDWIEKQQVLVLARVTDRISVEVVRVTVDVSDPIAGILVETRQSISPTSNFNHQEFFSLYYPEGVRSLVRDYLSVVQ